MFLLLFSPLFSFFVANPAATMELARAQYGEWEVEKALPNGLASVGVLLKSVELVVICTFLIIPMLTTTSFSLGWVSRIE
jgi:hypothetical protein